MRMPEGAAARERELYAVIERLEARIAELEAKLPPMRSPSDRRAADASCAAMRAPQAFSIAAGPVCAARRRAMSNLSERSKRTIPFCSWKTSVTCV